MKTDSFIVNVKTGDVYRSNVENVTTKFHTSSYELNRPLHKIKNKKVIGLIRK